MVANARPPHDRKQSYADYQTWADDERCEIIDGTVYAMNAPLRIHQEILGELFLQFASFLKGKPCKVLCCAFRCAFC